MSPELYQQFIQWPSNGMIAIPPESNLRWINLFYILPKEIVSQKPAYLELPRNMRGILVSEKYIEMIQCDAFLEMVWDGIAWAVWQFFRVPGKGGKRMPIPGDWQHYTGDFPLWKLCYAYGPLFVPILETRTKWNLQHLFALKRDEEVPWLSMEEFGDFVSRLTDIVTAEQNWQPTIDAIWENRQPEDYNGHNQSQRDFERSWTHSRTAPTVSLEELLESGEKISGEQLYDIPDPRSEFEADVITEVQMEQFKALLTEQDKEILELRRQGVSQPEIARRMGFKTASAVSKRIAKLGQNLMAFYDDKYGEFLDEHVE